MLTPRADHVMLSMGERVFVCGGWYEDTDTGNRYVMFFYTLVCYAVDSAQIYLLFLSRLTEYLLIQSMHMMS